MVRFKKSLASLVKNSGWTWWIFVSPGRVFVKNLVDNQAPPGLWQRSVKLSDGECVNKNIDQADRNNNLTRDGDAGFSKNDTRDDDRGTTGLLETPLVQNETVIKRTKRHAHLVRTKLKSENGKESSKPK